MEEPVHTSSTGEEDLCSELSSDVGSDNESEATPNETSEPLDCDWGVPLFLNEENEEDFEYLEGCSHSRQKDGEEQIPSDKEVVQEEDTGPEDKKPCMESDQPVFTRYAGMEGKFPVPHLFTRSQPSEYFYKKLYLNTKHPSKPRPKPRTVTYDYQVTKYLEQAIEIAIQIIQDAAPGLRFEKVNSFSANIYFGITSDGYSTTGSLRKPRRYRGNIKSLSVIRLQNKENNLLKTIVVHEMLHALGFEHEHQRRDAGHYLRVCHKYKKNDQVKVDPYVKPLTPFDRFSIMMYKIGHFVQLRGAEEINQQNERMSELDKIALNLTYPPAKIPGVYDPKLVQETGMYYCNRPVMTNHNQPSTYLVTHCGPDSGPNCPACRILSRPHHRGNARWQGQSGFVYCGKDLCGPDNEEPCEDCGKIIRYQ